MISKRIFIVITISIFLSSYSFAQETIGIFIHGFQGSSEKWTEISQIPNKWVEEKVIDGFIALDYETSELDDANVEALIRRLAIKISTEANKNGYSIKNDRWILIGHSLGGLVARSIYPHFKNNNTIGLNIVAVISVGGPMQGATATAVTTVQANAEFSRIRRKISNAYRHKISAINFAIDFLDKLNGSNYKNQVNSIPDYIKTARDSAIGYVGHIEQHEANALIGRDGSLINEINNYRETDIRNHPPQFLSVIGAEKSKVPIRIAGQIYTDVEELRDEEKMVRQFRKLRTSYFQLHEDLYHIEFNAFYFQNLTCRAGLRWFDLFNKCQPYEDAFKRARQYREEWKAAKIEIDNIDATWGRLINSNRFETATVREYVPPCLNLGGDGRGTVPGFYDLGTNPWGDICSTEPDGEYIYVDRQIPYPTKNDGVITIESGLWSKGDAFDDPHNIYMPDVYNRGNGDEGGFNHFELRNYARQYTLPGVFKEGDKNPSMERAEDWINNNL